MKPSNEALINACLNNNIEEAIKAIDKNLANVNTTITNEQINLNPSGSTPIIIACRSPQANRAELVSALLERGADITIRCSGGLFKQVTVLLIFTKKPTAAETIFNGNALDVALFFGRVDMVKMLLLHAALHLDATQQSQLLQRMPQKNILLYVAKTYPRYMEEMVRQILALNDVTCIQRMMTAFASSHGATPELINKYLQLFVCEEQLEIRKTTLLATRFDEHLNWFKKLPSNTHAITLIKNLENAKLMFMLDGNDSSFNQTVLDAIQTALPRLGQQACWKIAIGNFLEMLAVILPISRKQIEFYQKKDERRQLERMQEDLMGIASAPLLPDEVIYIPEAFVVETGKNFKR